MNATTCPVEASHASCFSASLSAASSAFVEQGFAATFAATAASSGIACAASNSFSSTPVTNSCPCASFTLKKWILRWWNAPRSAKHIAYGERRSASSASPATIFIAGGHFIATSAVSDRLLGVSSIDGMKVRRNSASACSRVSVGAPSPAPFVVNTVFFVAPLRHSSMASASRTISMCERYSDSDIDGYLVRIISRTVALNSWMLGGPSSTPESPHFATQLKLPFGGSHSISFASK